MKRTEISFPVTHRMRTVEGTLHLPTGDGSVPLVIFSHGYNGSQNDFRPCAEFLNDNGVAAYCFDFCGGSVRAQASLATTDMTLFIEAEDLEAVLAALQKHRRVDKNAVFLFGASQGGLVTALVAERHAQDVAAIALLFPALCIPDNWRERYPALADIPNETELWGMTLGRKFFESIRDTDPFRIIGAFPKKVLLLHGDRDDVVPLSFSERAAKLYPNAELVVFRGEGHGFSENGMRETARLLLELIRSPDRIPRI